MSGTSVGITGALDSDSTLSLPLWTLVLAVIAVDGNAPGTLIVIVFV